MYVVLTTIDIHTYPIIPAVKKSPSDIFVVFCLRSKRLKISFSDVAGDQKLRMTCLDAFHAKYRNILSIDLKMLWTQLWVSKNMFILSFWNVAYLLWVGVLGCKKGVNVSW